MHRFLTTLILVLLLASPVLYAEDSAWCSTCGGIIISADQMPEPPIPTLLLLSNPSDIQTNLRTLSAEQTARTVLIIPFDVAPGAAIDQVDARVTTLVDLIAGEGPLLGFGIRWTADSGALEAYALKRFSTTLQGRNLAAKILVDPDSLDTLQALYDNGAGPYFDNLLVSADQVSDAVLWLIEHDPVKRVVARVERKSANPLYDLAGPLANGAVVAFLDADPRTAPSISAFNQALSGDYSFDRSADIEILDASGAKLDQSAYAFVRGKDLRTMVIPPGNTASSTIVSLSNSDFSNPRRIEASGEQAITDTGKARGRYLVGIRPGDSGFLLSLDRPQMTDASITRESVDVVGQKLLPVEEIIRNHQAQWSFQETERPPYVARNQTSLRFELGDAAQTLEATIAGDHFFDKGLSDWVWQDFYVNGVRWKYGKIPELPLIQPEKVSRLPLDIHLTKDYHYELVRKTVLNGYETWEVAFRPPADAPEGLPLYRGTVWIDAHTWSRVGISMIQLNLSGEVLSNEERVEFQPFDRTSHRLMTPSEANEALPSSSPLASDSGWRTTGSLHRRESDRGGEEYRVLRFQDRSSGVRGASSTGQSEQRTNGAGHRARAALSGKDRGRRPGGEGRLRQVAALHAGRHSP